MFSIPVILCSDENTDYIIHLFDQSSKSEFYIDILNVTFAMGVRCTYFYKTALDGEHL